MRYVFCLGKGDLGKAKYAIEKYGGEAKPYWGKPNPLGGKANHVGIKLNL